MKVIICGYIGHGRNQAELATLARAENAILLVAIGNTSELQSRLDELMELSRPRIPEVMPFELKAYNPECDYNLSEPPIKHHPKSIRFHRQNAVRKVYKPNWK